MATLAPQRGRSAPTRRGQPRRGVIPDYALFGAAAQMRYTEAVATFDADVLVAVPPSANLDVLRRLDEFCAQRGCQPSSGFRRRTPPRAGDWQSAVSRTGSPQRGAGRRRRLPPAILFLHPRLLAQREHAEQRLQALVHRLCPSPPDLQQGGAPFSSRTALMIQAVQKAHSTPLTLKELAQRLNRTPDYLSDRFAHDVGAPFKRYLTEFRLARARELLGDPARSVADVAYAVRTVTAQEPTTQSIQATGRHSKVRRSGLQAASMSLSHHDA